MLEWHYISKKDYDKLSDIDKNKENLYFIFDTEDIMYKNKIFNEYIVLYDILPINPSEGKVYIDNSTLEGKIWTNNRWITTIRAVNHINTTDEYSYYDIDHIELFDNYIDIYLNNNSKDRLDFYDILIDFIFYNKKDAFLTIENEFCYTRNNKRIFLSDFISDIIFDNGYIDLIIQDSTIRICIGNIAGYNYKNTLSISVTGNEFVAESMYYEDSNNISEKTNNLIAILNYKKADIEITPSFYAISNYSTQSKPKSNTYSNSIDTMSNTASTMALSMQKSIEDKMNKVGFGHEGEILIANNIGDAKASGVVLGGHTLSNNPTNKTIATEKALNTYIKDNVIDVNDISTSESIDIHNTSDFKVISEKTLVSALTINIIE